MKEGISIVMAYFNRKIQLNRTLSSISKSLYDKSKLEIIIVNDASDDISDVVNNFSELNILLFNIRTNDKTWENSCIPFNIGFSLVNYDKVILQNPETYHNGDILTYVNNNLTDDNYLTFGYYSLSYTEFITNDYNNINIINKKFEYTCTSGWYNHSQYIPSYLHFCSAISYNNLSILRGFDEDYKNGVGFDDNEFLHRIKLLGLKLEIVDNPIVYHQWHQSSYHYDVNTDINIVNKLNKLFNDNKQLYNKTLQNNTYVINNNLFFNKNYTKKIIKDGISIVMTYHNRRNLLLKTLESINKSAYDKTKLQIIIVNDCSSIEHNIDDLSNLFKELNILIINLTEIGKDWINCCVPYNIGFNNIKYNRVMIQNPECYHNGDILTNTYNNLNSDMYLSYASYSLSWDDNDRENYDNIETLDEKFSIACGNGWYNHSIYHPTYYHYCSSITYENLCKLNGFDERYKDGIAWDDDEFITRVRNLNLELKLIDKPFVLHQAHTSVYRYNENTPKEVVNHRNNLFIKNQDLFQNKTKIENKYRAEDNIYFNIKEISQ